MIDYEYLYHQWSGKSEQSNLLKLVHDSADCITFAKHVFTHTMYDYLEILKIEIDDIKEQADEDKEVKGYRDALINILEDFELNYQIVTDWTILREPKPTCCEELKHNFNSLNWHQLNEFYVLPYVINQKDNEKRRINFCPFCSTSIRNRIIDLKLKP